MNRYSGDPYWTTAKWDGQDKEGNPVKRGTPIFYYPRTKTVLQGAAAEQAARDFQAAAQDEDFMNGGSW